MPQNSEKTFAKIMDFRTW